MSGLSYTNREGAHIRDELSQGKSTQTCVYRQLYTNQYAARLKLRRRKYEKSAAAWFLLQIICVRAKFHCVWANAGYTEQGQRQFGSD
jgi:hypothetical protein